jgi:hypothetical protein
MFDGCIPQKKEPSPFQLLSNIFMQYSGLDGTSIFPVVHCLSHLLPLQASLYNQMTKVVVNGCQFINHVLFFLVIHEFEIKTWFLQ